MHIGNYHLSNRAARLLRLAALVSLALMVIVAPTASAAPAQQSGGLDPSLSANFGSVDLSPGFMPDPYTVSMTSGGDVSAASAVDCSGYVTGNPDLELFLTDTSSGLDIFFVGDGDTTLIINDPYGQWWCNDDYSGLHPMVELGSAPGGTYDIWVGSYSADTYISGTLYITELGYSPADFAASSGSDTLHYAVVCIVNDTDVTVNYSFRWGDDNWSNRSVSPGGRRWHSQEYDAGERSSEDFRIRFDERLSGSDYFREYPLERHAASAEDCDQGHEYTFQYVNSSRIDLYDTEPE